MPSGAEQPRAPARPAPHVVLLDDDAIFLKTFAVNLERAGYRVASFMRPSEAIDALLHGAVVDACIIDWHMPEMDGLDVLRRLKQAGFARPIMVLTSMNQPLFEEAALEHGAVEFVDKTRSPAVILRRLALIIAGAKSEKATPSTGQGAEAGSETAVGALTLRSDAKRALWRGRQVGLSLGEFEAVALLARKAGTDVAYRELYDAVRSEGFIAGQGVEGYRTNVRAMVKRIRRKFTEIDPGFGALENYPGFGYRWRPDE
jgi:two-component system, OmpR family, response regulator ChvI